jgi:hypothetical protein
MLLATKQSVVRVDGAVSVVEGGDVLSSGDEVNVKEYGADEGRVDGYMEELSDSPGRNNVRLFGWLNRVEWCL